MSKSIHLSVGRQQNTQRSPHVRSQQASLFAPVAPIFKHVGGKTQLLAQLSQAAPPWWRQYHAPFAGGAADYWFFWNQGLIRRGSSLADTNQEIINLYTIVRDDVEALITLLHELSQYATSRSFYEEIRGWDRTPDWTRRPVLERAARFLFLNRTAYNGLYRVNRAGYFNAAFGHYQNPVICYPEALRASSFALQGIELLCEDFATVETRAQAGDYVYLDPPYDPVSATADFTGYTAAGFTLADQERVAELTARLVANGCWVVISNANTPRIRALYANYEITTVTAKRSINRDPTKRGAVEEVIILARPRKWQT